MYFFLARRLDFGVKVFDAGPKCDFFVLVYREIVRPRNGIQITYCSGIAGLRHSASVTLPHLFESDYNSITGRTVLIVNIDTAVCFVLSEICLFVIILQLIYTVT